MLNRALPPLALFVLAFLLLAANALAQDAPPPPKPALAQTAEARALFVANCAQCHGEKGDGEGVTQLDRKARSFLDGGFSYGNTREAILRSITHGIPGTPMPSFEKALTDVQRESLTQYVIAFGPDQIVVDPSESEMVVKDRPLIVRGKLPPIVEGAREWPRGLAIGTPDGLTFEYRADDVQLVGVRAGRFVNRADWGERGGAALEMLGKVVDDISQLRAPLFGLAESKDFETTCRLRATHERASAVTITYDVTIQATNGGTIVLASVDETPTAYHGEHSSGYKRSFRIVGREQIVRLHFVPALRNSTHGPFARSDQFELVWTRDQRHSHAEAPESMIEFRPGPLVVVRTKRGSAIGAWNGGGHTGFDFELARGESVLTEVFTIPNPLPGSWEQAAILAEFGQP